MGKIMKEITTKRVYVMNSDAEFNNEKMNDLEKVLMETNCKSYIISGEWVPLNDSFTYVPCVYITYQDSKIIEEIHKSLVKHLEQKGFETISYDATILAPEVITVQS